MLLAKTKQGISLLFALPVVVLLFIQCEMGQVVDSNQQNGKDNGNGTETSSFSCQGKTTCGEMASCAEATYYLQHCPNVTIDGDGDGIPCESQWCL
jgi:hypothetical protein